MSILSISLGSRKRITRNNHEMCLTDATLHSELENTHQSINTAQFN